MRFHFLRWLVALFMVMACMDVAFAEGEWVQTLGGEREDFATGVAATADGGTIVTGCTKSFGTPNQCNAWLVKLDYLGAIEWEKVYTATSSVSALVPVNVWPTLDGGYILGGTLGEGQSSRPGVVKVDEAGNPLWQKTYEVQEGTGTRLETVVSLSPTSDGGYLLLSNATWQPVPAILPRPWYLIRKLNENGNEVWTWGHLFASGAYGGALVETPDGEIVVAGSYSGPPEDPLFGVRVVVEKLSNAGRVVWNRFYGAQLSRYDNQRGPRAIAITDDGGFIVAGSDLNRSLNGWVMKLDDQGAMQWQRDYVANGFTWVTSIMQTPDGGYVFTGETRELEQEYYDPWVVKVDSTGVILWQHRYNASGYPASHQPTNPQIALAADGGYFLATRTDAFGAGGSDAWILKLNPNGVIGDSCPIVRTANLSILGVTETTFGVRSDGDIRRPSARAFSISSTDTSAVIFRQCSVPQ